MAERIRIALLMPGHWSALMGGAQYQAQQLVAALVASDQFEVAFLARNIAPGHRSTTYRLLPIENLLRRRQGHLYLDAPSIVAQLRQWRPRLIYQRVGCAYTGIAALCARWFGSRLVWQIAHDHELLPPHARSPVRRFDQQLLAYGIRRSDAIIAQTHDQARALRHYYQRDCRAILPNFHPLPTEQLLKQGVRRVLWIANLKRFKRPEIFIRLARELATLPVEFVMIGAMQGEGGWQADIVRAINTVPTLRWLGGCSQQQVNQLLASAHLLVNTSDAEGFSNTFIQAWLRQVPVVSLRVDPDQILQRGEVGYACGGNFDLLRERVRQLLIDTPLRQRLGQNAQQHALAQHGPAVAQRFVTLFAALSVESPQLSVIAPR